MYLCAVHFDTFDLLCPVSYLEHACYFAFPCNRCNKEHFELELELEIWTWTPDSTPVTHYIMAGHAIVVVKDINLLFYHGNAVILTLRLWLNDGKWFVWCKFNYINNYLWLVKNNNHLKPRYTEPCNFLTKRAWVSQQCTLVVAKDSNISHYLNSWAYLVMIILAII